MTTHRTAGWLMMMAAAVAACNSGGDDVSAEVETPEGLVVPSTSSVRLVSTSAADAPPYYSRRSRRLFREKTPGRHRPTRGYLTISWRSLAGMVTLSVELVRAGWVQRRT